MEVVFKDVVTQTYNVRVSTPTPTLLVLTDKLYFHWHLNVDTYNKHIVKDCLNAMNRKKFFI